jgi:hypothetical protein
LIASPFTCAIRIASAAILLYLESTTSWAMPLHSAGGLTP